MENGKYCIVEFFPETPGETNPTEIVPNIWIDSSCKAVYWPPKTPTALKVAIKRATESPSRNWGIHRYNRILAVCDNYSEASGKLTKSLDTSNLESEQEINDQPLQKKLRIHRNKQSQQQTSSDDSDLSSDQGEESIPQLPTFAVTSDNSVVRTCKVSEKTVSQQIETPIGNTTVTGNSSSTASSMSEHQLPITSPITSSLGGFRSVTGSLNQQTDWTTPATTISSKRLFVQPDDSFVSQVSLTEQPLTANELEDPTVTIASLADVADLKTYMTECTEKLIRMITSVSEEVKEIKAYLHNTRTSGSTPKLDFTKIPSLPLLNREQINQFENWLTFEANRDILREYLELLGGDNTEKCSRAILKKLISKPLRKEINFTGKGGKIAFQSIRIYQILKESVRLTRTDAKESDIQHAVIEWLRNAKKNE